MFNHFRTVRRCTVVAFCFALGATLLNTGARADLSHNPDAHPFTTHVGSVTTQGDAVMNSDDARSTFNVNGDGIKIGVISDSFNTTGSNPNVSSQIDAGDLPGVGNPNGFTNPVNVFKDDSNRTDEGRALLEIVHDVAPGAELSFHSAFNNTSGPAPGQTIADAIDNLAAGGMDIIVDDVGILTAPRFQDGPAAQAVDNAKANGTAYFSSAGNSARNASRHTFSGSTGDSLSFGTDDVLDINFPTGNSRLVVQWDDPYQSVSGTVPGGVTDFSVDVTDSSGSTLFTVDGNGTGDDPFEFLSVNNSGSGSAPAGIRINQLSGDTDKTVQVSVFGGLNITDSDDTNAPTIFGQAAAEGAVSVAAIRQNESGLDDVEGFSSRGPTDIFFDANGNPVDITRETPLITAPDGVSTTTSGFGTFFGTSAASPHAAAVAALILERADDLGVSLSVDDLYQTLFDTAIDIEATGFDNLSGNGRIDAFAAVNSVIPAPTASFAILLAGIVAAFFRPHPYRRAA